MKWIDLKKKFFFSIGEKLAIRNFLKSSKGNFQACKSPTDLKLAIVRANLSVLNSFKDKVQLIRNMMDDTHFQDKLELRKLLELVQDEDPEILNNLQHT